MAKLTHDDFELTKCVVEIGAFSHEMESLLRYVNHTGITFKENNTSVAGDRYSNNTVILDNYGRLTLGIATDPKATNLAVYCQAQIDGKNSGDKPTDAIAFFDSEGNETSRFNIERWHMEEYRIGPFDAKSSANLEQSCTIDMEKFTRA